jgi:hypothetical protein
MLLSELETNTSGSMDFRQFSCGKTSPVNPSQPSASEHPCRETTVCPVHRLLFMVIVSGGLRLGGCNCQHALQTAPRRMLSSPRMSGNETERGLFARIKPFIRMRSMVSEYMSPPRHSSGLDIEKLRRGTVPQSEPWVVRVHLVVPA